MLNCRVYYLCWLLTVCSWSSVVDICRGDEHSKTGAKANEVTKVLLKTGLKFCEYYFGKKVPEEVTTILEFATKQLVSRYWKDGMGDPKHDIRIEEWNKLGLEQKKKMIDFRISLQEIQRHINTTLTSEDENQRTRKERSLNRMVMLRDDMCRSRCSLFMRSCNCESDAAYFKEFATFFIAVNQLVICLYPDEKHWLTDLHKHIGYFIIHARHLMSRFSSFYYLLRPSLDEWMELLDPESRDAYDVNVRYNREVSFKINDKAGHWYRCSTKNMTCYSSVCPGLDNHMQDGSQYCDSQRANDFICGGETFKLKNMKPSSDDVVRSCDGVGIYFKQNEPTNNHYWVTLNDAVDHNTFEDSESCDKSFPGNISVCAGESTTWTKNGKCEAQAWKIHARGRPCGSPIADQDIIYFTNLHRWRVCLHTVLSSPKSFWFCNNSRYATGFVVFRNDLCHVSRSEKLPCD